MICISFFFSGLWGLVNNAGIIGTFGPLQLQLTKHVKQTFDVNFFGLVNVTKAFLPLLKKSKGRIVNMSSGNGLMATCPNWPYVATKFAVEGFTDSIRYEHVIYRIRRNKRPCPNKRPSPYFSADRADIDFAEYASF